MHVFYGILVQVNALLFQSGLYYIDVQGTGLYAVLHGKSCGGSGGLAKRDTVWYPVGGFICGFV